MTQTMKRLLSTMLVLTLMFSSVPGLLPMQQVSAAGDFAGGTGTQADPYLIATADQFNKLRDSSYLNKSIYFRLKNDIDLS